MLNKSYFLAGLLMANLSTAAISLNKDSQDDPVAFVFEVVRHGARAPIDDFGTITKFPVSAGQLTPQGMRQRFLLGSYHRERYTETYPLLNPTFNPEEVYVQSTDVNRTITSAYSELLGMYPPGSDEDAVLTDNQVRSLESGRGMPPFKVRGADQVNRELGYKILPDGFVALPVYTFIDHEVADDVNFNGCEWVHEVQSYRRPLDSSYSDYLYIQSDIQSSVEAAYGYEPGTLDGISYDYMLKYTDTLTAEDFENIDVRQYFTDDLWLESREMQKVVLALMFTKDTRDLFLSRMMRKPLRAMQSKIEQMTKQKTVFEDDALAKVKYMLYSDHDDQIDNMWVWLNATNFDFDYIKYASTAVFELRYNEQCLAESRSNTDCFWFNVRANGVDLYLDGCRTNEPGCSYDEFVQFMNKIWYKGNFSEDLDEACYQPFVAPTDAQNEDKSYFMDKFLKHL